jgi:hypothetical protein
VTAAVALVSVFIFSPASKVIPALPVIQVLEPVFWIKTLPPEIDKTVNGVFAVLLPQADIPKSKDIVIVTRNNIRYKTERVECIFSPCPTMTITKFPELSYIDNKFGVYQNQIK